MIQQTLERPSAYYIETVAAHHQAIEQVISAMHEHLCDPLSLDDMADIACLSPYYFNRVFHRIIGVPPGEFFAALRMDEAKRLLLTTSLSVTDICFELGYASLGSFTTRFTQLTGMPPRQLRQLAAGFSPALIEPQRLLFAERRLQTSSLRGVVSAPRDFAGLVFMGLFTKPIPQGLPIRSTVLSGPGAYLIDDVPPGAYYLLVAALPAAQLILAQSWPVKELLVAGCGPLFVGPRSADVQVNLELRPHEPTDPPILLAVPYISIR